MPTLRSAKDVQKFMGLANYYRQLIQDFSRVAKPLNMLVGKDRKWEWRAEQEKVFEELKRRFTTEPVLAVPDRDQEMRVEVDASDYVMGGILSVKGVDGKWRPVAFISKLLSPAERNYEIHDKEMLAVIQCLEDWRHYLEGTKKEFEIWTDHKNLQYFISSQKLNHRQARWALYLSRFNFILKHVPGKSMGKVDSLSRRPDWQVGIDKDNEDRVLVKKEWLRRAKETLVEEDDLRERIREAQEKDKQVVKAVEELKRSGIKSIKDKEWSIKDGLVLKEERIYMLEGTLRVEVIWW